jgi:K+/H+ antiporter YhaU regulatory subunit KhtT
MNEEKEIMKILKANRDSYIINDNMKIVDPIILEERFESIAQSIHKIYQKQIEEKNLSLMGKNLGLETQIGFLKEEIIKLNRQLADKIINAM